MGPYCKFCNNRCFVPTKEHDIIKKVSLKATCKEGRLFDLVKTRDQVQSELDHGLSECFTDLEMQTIEREWNTLTDLIIDLEKELVCHA